MKIDLHLTPGELHSGHFGRLLFQFAVKRRDRLIALFDLGAQDLALVSRIAHLLQPRSLIRLVLIPLVWNGGDGGRFRAAMDSDSISGNTESDKE
jgi:hypothetical protein